jgi:hypothetical protein
MGGNPEVWLAAHDAQTAAADLRQARAVLSKEQAARRAAAAEYGSADGAHVVAAFRAEK